MGLDITFHTPNGTRVEHFRSFHALNEKMGFVFERELSEEDVLQLIRWCTKLKDHPAVKADYLTTFANVLAEFDEEDCPHVIYRASW